MKSHGLAPGSKGQVPSLEARICSSDQEIAYLAEYGDSLSRSQVFGTGPRLSLSYRVRVVTHYFRNMYINVILPSTQMPPTSQPVGIFRLNLLCNAC